MKVPLVLFLSVMAAAGCSGNGVEARAGEGADPAVIVDAAVVETRPLRRAVEAVGTLDPNEEVVVSSQVEALVEKVLVDVSDAVRPGQLLVSLDARELELNVEQQAAALMQELARLGLTEDRADINETTTTQVRQAEATFREAKLRLDRVRKLTEEGVMAQQTLDEAKARFDVAEASLNAALETVRNIRASISARSASLGLARKRLADARILAPLAGFVKERLVAPGQLVRVNSAVMTIVQNDPLRLRVEVPESAVRAIEVGQDVSFTVDGVPGETFQGRVSRLSPSIDRQSRTLKVEVLVRNSSGRLKPGYFARARVETHQVDHVPVVPSEAIANFAGIEKVFVIEGGKVRERIVRTGVRADGHVEIVEGLKTGDRIAVSNVGNLQQGREVQVR